MLMADTAAFNPTLSKDGLTIIFEHIDEDIYEATRPSVHEPFDLPVPIDVINTSSHDGTPSLSDNGLTLFFASNSSGLGSFDLYVSERESQDDDWSEPVNVGAPINTGGFERDPALSVDKRTLVFSSDLAGTHDVMYSTRDTEGPWSEPVPFSDAINTPFAYEAGPSLSSDGQSLYFDSFSTGADLFVSTKEDGIWTDRIKLQSHLSSDRFDEFQPEISTDGSRLLFTRGTGFEFSSYRIWEATVLGDVDYNGMIEDVDMDLLSAAVGGGDAPAIFDLNRDGSVDTSDRVFWVEDVKASWFGDSNLDGEFNSGDLVAVFQAGEYEDSIGDNSGWASGDWDGDGDFTSEDLVTAFQDGGYEKGPRMAANAVPEPTTMAMLITALIGVAIRRRCVVS